MKRGVATKEVRFFQFFVIDVKTFFVVFLFLKKGGKQDESENKKNIVLWISFISFATCINIDCSKSDK